MKQQEQFVELLISMNDDCFRVLSSYWRPLELMTLLDTFPKLKRRVQLAFRSKKGFQLQSDRKNLDRNTINNLVTALLMCGPSLERITYTHSKSMYDLGNTQYVNLATLAFRRKNFGRKLASVCPNIERIEMFTPYNSNREAAHHVRVLADYAEHLDGKCKLKKLTIPLRDESGMKQVSRVLRSCCALEEIEIDYDSARGESKTMLLDELQNYQNKDKSCDVQKVGINCSDTVVSSQFEYERFSFDVLSTLTELQVITIKLVDEGDEDDEDDFAEQQTLMTHIKRIADLINSRRKIKRVHLLTTSLRVVNLISDELIHTLDLRQSVWDPNEVEERDKIRKKQFRNLKQLNVRVYNEEYEFLQEPEVFPHMTDVCVRDGLLPTIKFFETKGRLIKRIKVRLWTNHEQQLSTIAQHCVNLEYAKIYLVQEESLSPDVELLRKLNLINSNRRDSEIELKFHSKTVYESFNQVYEQLLTEVNDRTKMRLQLKMLGDLHSTCA